MSWETYWEGQEPMSTNPMNPLCRCGHPMTSHFQLQGKYGNFMCHQCKCRKYKRKRYGFTKEH